MRLPLAEVDALLLDMEQPVEVVALGEPEEKSLHFDVVAIFKKVLQSTRAERPQPFHEVVCLMKGFPLWYLVQQLQYCPFWR